MTNTVFLQKALSEILCCPICKNDLELIGIDELKCISCFKRYLIRDGIPVLLATDVSKDQVDEQRLREEIARKHGYIKIEEILKIVSYHHCLSVMSKRAKEFRAKFNPSSWILDVGCGTGYYWCNTGDTAGNLILMDFALGNLKAAKSLLKEQNHIIFMQADAANLPIRTHRLSGIWSVQVTQHFPDLVMKNFLSEVKRILKNSFLIEIYNLNPALLHKIIYKLFYKKLHIKGKSGSMVLNRLNADELINLWKGIAGDAKHKVGYSELFFHPDFHLRPRNRYLYIIENILRKVPWIARGFARQIHIRSSSNL